MSFPSTQEIINRIIVDYIKNTANVDNTLPNSMLMGRIIGSAGRFTECYSSLSQFINAFFLLNGSGDFLDQWGTLFNVKRKVATVANGTVFVTGDNGVFVPTGTTLVAQNGQTYTTTTLHPHNEVGIFFFNATVDISGLVATLEFANHGLATGVTVNISGGSNPVINGNYTVVVKDSNTFEITLSAFIGNGDFGTANVLTQGVNLSVTSTSASDDANLAEGAQLSYQTPIAGLDNTAYVNIGGIIGGSDEENDADYRDRVIFRIQNPGDPTSIPGQVNALLAIGGITRAWGRGAHDGTGANPGSSILYYVRDNDSPIFPSGTDTNDVKAQLTIPGEQDPANFIVASPVNNIVNFDFSSITPDEDGIREAITNSLTQFFRYTVSMGFEMGGTLKEVDYDRVLKNTINPDTGSILEAYTLNTPVGDVAIADNELPTRGTISFTP